MARKRNGKSLKIPAFPRSKVITRTSSAGWEGRLRGVTGMARVIIWEHSLDGIKIRQWTSLPRRTTASSCTTEGEAIWTRARDRNAAVADHLPLVLSPSDSNVGTVQNAPSASTYLAVSQTRSSASRNRKNANTISLRRRRLCVGQKEMHKSLLRQQVSARKSRTSCRRLLDENEE